MDGLQPEMRPSERLFDLVTKPGEDVYKAADLLDIAHAMANVEFANDKMLEALKDIVAIYEGDDELGYAITCMYGTAADAVAEIEGEAWRDG